MANSTLKTAMKKAHQGHHVGFKRLAKEKGAPLAAYIGRKKYGKAGFAALAAAGRAKHHRRGK